MRRGGQKLKIGQHACRLSSQQLFSRRNLLQATTVAHVFLRRKYLSGAECRRAVRVQGQGHTTQKYEKRSGGLAGCFCGGYEKKDDEDGNAQVGRKKNCKGSEGKGIKQFLHRCHDLATQVFKIGSIILI